MLNHVLGINFLKRVLSRVDVWIAVLERSFEHE